MNSVERRIKWIDGSVQAYFALSRQGHEFCQVVVGTDKVANKVG